MKILSLNCQRAHQPGLKNFLSNTLNGQNYEVLLLQEVNDVVAEFLKHPTYKIIRHFNHEAGQHGQVCIVYKNSCKLFASEFKSFASMRHHPVYGFKHPSASFVWADLGIGPTIFRFTSIHLRDGIRRSARIEETKLTKNLLTSHPSQPPVILAGDFNTGFPKEDSKIAKMLGPELVWQTKNIGPTLDSRFSENFASIPNRVAALLRTFNLKIRLKTDHIFIDSRIAGQFNTQCSVLQDRVSDHSPVEFVFDPLPVYA